MRCRTLRKRLSGFLDGELSHQQAAQIKQHLASCAACRQEAEELSQTYQLLGEWTLLSVPDISGFKKPVALAPGRDSVFRAWSPLRRAAVAACVFGLLIGAVLGLMLQEKLIQERFAASVTPEQQYVRAWGMEALEELPPNSLEGVYITLAGLQRR